MGRQDWAREEVLRPVPSHASCASSAAQRRGPVAPTAPNELLAAAFCKGKLSSGSKPQPQRASDRESNASRFRPRPPALHRANRGWAALATWALLLFWLSPVPETHSPQVLLGGEAGLGARRPSAPRPQPCSLSQLGRSARGPVAPTSQNELLVAAFGKGKVNSGSNQQPQRASAQEGNASLFRHRPSALQRTKRGGAAPGSLGPAALLGVSGARNPLPTGSPSWGSRIGRAKAFCAQAPAMPPEPARPLSAKAPSHRRPKTSFWQLHCTEGKSPGAANNSPNAPRSGKQRKPFSVPALHSPEGKAVRGCSWLHGPC